MFPILFICDFTKKTGNWEVGITSVWPVAHGIRSVEENLKNRTEFFSLPRNRTGLKLFLENVVNLFLREKTWSIRRLEIFPKT